MKIVDGVIDYGAVRVRTVEVRQAEQKPQTLFIKRRKKRRNICYVFEGVEWLRMNAPFSVAPTVRLRLWQARKKFTFSKRIAIDLGCYS